MILKDCLLDVALSCLLGYFFALGLGYIQTSWHHWDFLTLALMNVWLLLSLHVLTGVVIRYSLISIVVIPLMLLYMQPWSFGLSWWWFQLARYIMQ